MGRSSTLIKPTSRGSSLKGLNTQQRMFVEYILADEFFDATKAANMAGYAAPAVSANKLLKNRQVAAAVGKAIQERIKEVKLDQKSVLNHLTTALFLDPAELFDFKEDGSFTQRDLRKVPVEVRRCITKMKSRSYYDKDGNVQSTTHELEFMSKDTALALAMKHLGLAGADTIGFNVTADAGVLLTLLREIEESKKGAVIDANYIERSVTDVDVGPSNKPEERAKASGK